MKLLYWLDEWLTNSRSQQQARLPMTGSDLLDDVFVKYEFVDLDKPLLFTFSPDPLSSFDVSSLNDQPYKMSEEEKERLDFLDEIAHQ